MFLKVNSQKKVKTSQGFHFFFVSHSGVGFGKVLAVVFLLAAHSAVGFWKVLAVETNHKNTTQNAAWLSCFFSGLIEVPVLENSGCGNQFTKKVATPHGFPIFFVSHSFRCYVFSCSFWSD